MVDTEEYFPRGGKKPTTKSFKQSANFLGAAEKSERKKKKPKKKYEGDDGYLSDEATKELYKSSRNGAIGLCYKTIKQGVLILGRVRYVQETKIIVMLPNRLIGNVMACHISEPYNKLLEAYVNDQTENVRELSQMFRPGQYIAVKVLEVDGQRLMLSTMPQHVYSAKRQADLHKGAIFQAAVSSVEDHGYVMDVGIPNTRVFLPKSEANPEVDLDTGMITWCTVKSVTPSSDSSIVTVSGALASLQRGSTRSKPDTPLTPASAVRFTVDTPLDNGIQGHVFEDVTAYILRQHADKVKGRKPALGQKISARVLYVMPTRNTPFLTMRDIFETTYPDLQEEQKLKDGDIIEDGQVLKITGRSIHFKLGQGCVGTMSLKRIQIDEDLTDEEVIAKSYPVGSTHKVRVLCYNMSDYVYSVTDEPSVVNEKYFSLGQVAAGALVEGAVKSVADSHVVVTVGRLVGYVPQTHLSDIGVFIDPKKSTTSMLSKKKYKVGQQVRARVLSVDTVKQSLYLTLKPSLLAPELEVLQSYEQAEIGKAYTGTIKVIRDYVLVSFFNNVCAFVPRNYVTKEATDNLAQAFHIGQIVKCTILSVDAETKKMSGSLTTAPFWPAKKRVTGNKRKHNHDNTDIPHKKHKSDNEQTDRNHKKRDKIPEIDVDEENTEENRKKKKRDKNTREEIDEQEIGNKKKGDKISENLADIERDSNTKKRQSEVSEESDAIETDFQADSDQILTPQDMGLIDMSDCVTAKNYKKRTVSLLKAINSRTRRMDVVEQKIASIEQKGLNAKNKKFHTAMHSEKLVIEERLKKLLEAFKIAQEKLKEFGLVDNKDYKKKKEKVKKEETQVAEKENKDNEVVKTKEVEKKKKEKKKDIKVVESLEPALDVPSVKNFWTMDNAESLSKNVQEEESSSSEDEQEEQTKKKRKKLTVAEKLAKVREEEERVREMERRAIESEAQPRSSEQFERALLANPNCSQLWIAYMAFHLQATEIEKARAVARKALNTISFREEQEKLNVWLALINIENRFGTEESQRKTLEEALQMNDTFKVHSKVLDIYVETSKHQELSSLVDVMMRKYKRDPNTYIMCGAACFKLGLVDKARHVMQKAIAVLEKKEHVSVLVQFALLERGAGGGGGGGGDGGEGGGGRERAEALLEQVLAVYPQRVDVAAVYVDMLLKDGDVHQLRQVMERMTSQKLPARKMKILYKKWIEVEEKIGDSEHVERIRQRAMEYVEKAKF